MSLRAVLYYLREYLFPSGCGGCGEALFVAEDAYYGLCSNCRASFGKILVMEKQCKICGKLLISENGICLSCREKAASGNSCHNEWLVRLQILFPSDAKFRKVIKSYKFGKVLGLGNFFARCLDFSLESFENEILKKAAWVPVPPRPGKMKKHGWDQIEFLAGLLERKYKLSKKKQLPESRCLPLFRCLNRLPSRSQKELNQKEREKNLKGRIICKKPPPEIAILFDDILTTGATMNACARALLEGGCKKVYGVCLFYG